MHFQAFKLYLASLEETIRHNPDSHFYIFLPSPEYLVEMVDYILPYANRHH